MSSLQNTVDGSYKVRRARFVNTVNGLLRLGFRGFGLFLLGCYVVNTFSGTTPPNTPTHTGTHPTPIHRDTTTYIYLPVDNVDNVTTAYRNNAFSCYAIKLRCNKRNNPTTTTRSSHAS